jgi:hypothetical protein
MNLALVFRTPMNNYLVVFDIPIFTCYNSYMIKTEFIFGLKEHEIGSKIEGRKIMDRERVLPEENGGMIFKYTVRKKQFRSLVNLPTSTRIDMATQRPEPLPGEEAIFTKKNGKKAIEPPYFGPVTFRHIHGR